MKNCLLAIFLALAGACGAQAQTAPAAAASAPTLRPEIAPPMLAAQKALGEKKYDEAMQHLKAAQAVPNRTPYGPTRSTASAPWPPPACATFPRRWRPTRPCSPARSWSRNCAAR
jgi:hypothetical protein